MKYLFSIFFKLLILFSLYVTIVSANESIEITDKKSMNYISHGANLWLKDEEDFDLSEESKIAINDFIEKYKLDSSTEKIKSGMKSLYSALQPYVCPVSLSLLRSNPLRLGPLPIQYAFPRGTAFTLSGKNSVSLIRCPLRMIVLITTVSPSYGFHSIGLIMFFGDKSIVCILKIIQV